MSEPCKHCYSTEHTSFYCFRKYSKLKNPGDLEHLRPPSQRRTPTLRVPLRSHPLRTRGNVANSWLATRKKWLELFGTEHVCHYCGQELSADHIELEANPHKGFLTLDHLESRARHPELRYVLGNLVPACERDNRLKGSLSHDEFVHECHT